ncbi:MAG: rhomboid family intramembrane serine protease [Gemmatimonadota bacterium]
MAYRGTQSFGFGFRFTPMVKNLLIANTAVFLLQNLWGPIYTYGSFTPAYILIKPWSLFTYMFLHGDFWHLFWNMLGLFFFGPALEERWGSKEFLKFYLVCGLGGAVFSFFFAFNASVIGASGAVYGVLLAFAMFWPNMPIYIWGIIPVPARILVGVFVLFSLFSAFQGSGGNIAHFAHLGGFAFAYLYIKFGGSPGNPFRRLKQNLQKRRMHVVRSDDDAATRAAAPPSTRRPSGPEEEQVLDELDRVLDKINEHGMASLTTQERQLLDDVSRRFRTH